MTSPSTPATPPPPQPAWPVYTSPPRGNGLAITAIVLSSMALLGVLLIVLLAVFTPDGDTYRLDGHAQISAGRVSAAELERKVRNAIDDDGGDVSKVSCPESAKAGASLSVLCDTTIDGAGWAALVVFNNDRGDFALVLY